MTYGGLYVFQGLTRVTDPPGVVILEHTYDGNARVATQRLGNGGVSSFQYELEPDSTRKVWVTDPNNNVVAYHLGSRGDGYGYDPLDTTSSLGRVTTYSYAASGLCFMT